MRSRPFLPARAAHSAAYLPGRPKTEAPRPSVTGRACAMTRAEVTGRRRTEAAWTAALSMIRLMIISLVSSGTSTGSAATRAIL